MYNKSNLKCRIDEFTYFRTTHNNTKKKIKKNVNNFI